MPVLVLAVAEYLNELLQDCRLTTVTALRELSRIVVMTVDLAIVFVVTVLSPEHRWTERTSKVVYVILALQSGDVGPSQSSPTLMTEEAESSEVVGFAKGVLSLPILIICREEFRCHYLAAVLFGDAS